MGAPAQLPLEQYDVQGSSERRPPGSAAVGAPARLPVEQDAVHGFCQEACPCARLDMCEGRVKDSCMVACSLRGPCFSTPPCPSHVSPSPCVPGGPCGGSAGFHVPIPIYLPRPPLPSACRCLLWRPAVLFRFSVPSAASRAKRAPWRGRVKRGLSRRNGVVAKGCDEARGRVHNTSTVLSAVRRGGVLQTGWWARTECETPAAACAIEQGKLGLGGQRARTGSEAKTTKQGGGGEMGTPGRRGEYTCST